MSFKVELRAPDRLFETLMSRKTLSRELVKGVDFTMRKPLSVLILLCFGKLLVLARVITLNSPVLKKDMIL